MSAVIKHKDTYTFSQLPLELSWFNEEEKDTYKFIRDFVTKYGKTPGRKTVEQQTGAMLVNTKEPVDYYYDELRERFIQRYLKAAMKSARDVLLDPDKKPSEAMEIIKKKSLALEMKANRGMVSDFTKEGWPTLLHDYQEKQSQGLDYGVRTGWPTLDNMTYGLVGGDYLSIVGKTSMGKTWLIMWIMFQAWLWGKTPMVISMEMKPLLVMQRLAAITSKLPMSYVKAGQLTQDHYTHLKGTMLSMSKEQRPMWVVDGNFNATVEDVHILTSQFKPDILLIDGAYMLRCGFLGKAAFWEHIQEGVQYLKQHVTSNLNVPTVASYQFNKEGAKKQTSKGPKGKKEPVSTTEMLYNIRGGDAISHTSSIILGMFEEEAIHTKKRRRVDIVKGRSGEAGIFRINWDHYGMDFSEYNEDEDEEMKYL